MNDNIKTLDQEIEALNQEIEKINKIIDARSRDIAQITKRIKGYLKEGEKHN